MEPGEDAPTMAIFPGFFLMALPRSFNVLYGESALTTRAW